MRSAKTKSPRSERILERSGTSSAELLGLVLSRFVVPFVPSVLSTRPGQESAVTQMLRSDEETQ